MARLTKQQREQVRQMFEGRCAYCGEPLGDRWHVDHVEPVNRAVVSVKTAQGWRLRSGPMLNPERDQVSNYMPACPPCNISKSTFSLEQWRQALLRHVASLNSYTPIYRMVKRFGLIAETGSPVTFYFERAASQAAEGERNHG